MLGQSQFGRHACHIGRSQAWRGKKNKNKQAPVDLKIKDTTSQKFATCLCCVF